MKIGIVCYPSYGGSGVVATELGKRLAYRGHEIHFISYDRPFKLNLFHENIFFHEVDIVDYPLFNYQPYSLALASKIYEVAKWARLDILHVHYAIPHAASAYLAKQMLEGDLDLPVITTLHGTDITIVGHDKQFYDITRFSIMKSEGVTAVSESLKNETLRLFEMDREIEVIYNFVDFDEYRRIPCADLKNRFTEGSEKILIHISNFRPVKRLKDVIDIFRLVNREVPSKLLLVGDGPDGPFAHKYVDDLGLTDSVFFLGKQERVVELLSISDFCLLPSEKESFGLAALEAMACEVPVIGSRVGGIPEVVSDYETGVLEEVGDVKAMARRVVEILNDEKKYSQMASMSRQAAKEKFTADAITKTYECYYQQFC